MRPQRVRHDLATEQQQMFEHTEQPLKHRKYSRSQPSTHTGVYHWVTYRVLRAGRCGHIANQLCCKNKSSLVAQLVKNLPAMRETWVRFLGSKDPLEKGTATHSSILPGEFHGQRSLAGYSPCGHKEADTTE